MRQTFAQKTLGSAYQLSIYAGLGKGVSLLDFHLVRCRKQAFENASTKLYDLAHSGVSSQKIRAAVKSYHADILAEQAQNEAVYAGVWGGGTKYGSAGRLQAYRFILKEIDWLLGKKVD